MPVTDFILKFAGEHWFLSFLIICAVYYTLKTPYLVWNRFLRSRNIKHHGWPSNPLMDADGDIIHPEKSDS